MARSVHELRQDSERCRAQLEATVDLLRERIGDKVSPEAIKSEVSGYIKHKGKDWVAALQQQALDNPMQAVAIGTAVAVPALRLVRAFPLPLLVIGAGVALSSKNVRSNAASAAAPALQRIKDAAGDAVEGLRAARDNASEAVASVGEQATDKAARFSAAVSGVMDNLQTRASRAADQITTELDARMEAAGDRTQNTIDRAGAQARQTMAAAPAVTSRFIRENAVLVGGLGVAIGAVIAASLPASKPEVVVAAGAADGAKRFATKAANSGVDAAKEKVFSAAEAAAESVARADLDTHASRMTRNMADTLKNVAEDVVTTAFNPSHNQQHS